MFCDPNNELMTVEEQRMIEIKSSFPKRHKFNDEDIVCYCFGHTKKDIEDDFKANNRSLIYEKVVFEKQAGGCKCASKNPNGK